MTTLFEFMKMSVVKEHKPTNLSLHAVHHSIQSLSCLFKLASAYWALKVWVGSDTLDTPYMYAYKCPYVVSGYYGIESPR